MQIMNGWEAGRDTGDQEHGKYSHRKGTDSLLNLEGNTEMIIKGEKCGFPFLSPRTMS